VAALSTLDAEALRRVRANLEALNGVVRVIMDESADALCVICDPEAEADPLDLAVRETLIAEGIDPTTLSIEIAVRPGRGTRQRVRFIGVERLGMDTGMLGVRVTLEWQGRRYTGEASGETGLVIEQRTAATAALQAIERLIGSEVGLRLIGVKQIRAFDTELVVSSIHRPGPPAQRFVGTVIATDDPLRGATLSVLHALNRMMGNFLATTD
jgi:hypothetical protein